MAPAGQATMGAAGSQGIKLRPLTGALVLLSGERPGQRGGQHQRVAARPLRQFRCQAGQLGGAPGAQPSGGHLADAAEDDLRGEARREGGGEAVARQFGALLERLQRASALLERIGSGAEGAEQEQGHRVGV